MNHVALTLRPSAASVRLSDTNPKLVELEILSQGLSLTIDMPRIDFEVIVAKWADLCRNEGRFVDSPQIGLFRRAP